MKEKEIIARRDKLLREESTEPTSWWWLSFADKSGFLGAVLIKASGFVTAHTYTHLLGINPGGECVGYQVSDDVIYHQEAPFKPEDHCDKLLSKEYIDKYLGGAAKMP